MAGDSNFEWIIVTAVAFACVVSVVTVIYLAMRLEPSLHIDHSNHLMACSADDAQRIRQPEPH